MGLGTRRHSITRENIRRAVVKYEILRRELADELVEAVNSYINTGWEPLGGVVYSFTYRPDDNSPTALWCQAIMKRHPAEPL
jgi:hypothetical protein